MRSLRNLKSLGAIQSAWARLKFPPNPAVSNPETRAEISADFPGSISPYSADAAKKLIEQQLEKRSLTLKDVERINIVYPQKHPGLFPKHRNSAFERAVAFQERLQEKAPDVHWVLADHIVERHRLGRSENQSSFYALTARQQYDLYSNAKPSSLPDGEFFVIVDNTIEQGTTIANLLTFLKHNGGDVLMVQGDRHAPIAQQVANGNPVFELGAPFNDVARNTGRLPALAVAFSRSAAKDRVDIEPNEAIAAFDLALNGHGNSVFAMTDGEALHLLQELKEGQESFLPLIQKLQATKPALKSRAYKV
ncbi:MAG TPA: hypothetical protein VEF76_14970 [Patescibacteria group bacterium]|nr:hypothetical protein [Patescibacteria group bacterium]